MPTVDLMDETFIVATAEHVADALHAPSLWRSWWPDLRLVVDKDRGVQGLQFSISGPLVGTGELWLESFGDGVIVHAFLRADPTDPTTGEIAALPMKAIWREARKRAWQTKRGMGLLKDALEGDRPAGERRVDLVQPIPTV